MPDNVSRQAVAILQLPSVPGFHEEQSFAFNPKAIAMAKRFILLVYAMAMAIAGVKADDSLTDFSNNLASDLGPLLVLFGDAVTQQYLSESTTFLDYFIFAMAPIGVITAMISAIRVCGSSSLRAFIGRAQEGEGIIEAELCTSTSRDVCELFNKGGITRVLGPPSILELVYLPPSSSETLIPPQAQPRLHLFSRYLEKTTNRSNWKDYGWVKVKPFNLSRFLPAFDKIIQAFHDHTSSKDEKHVVFAPKPNLSLNVGIKRQPEWVFYIVATIGFVLQVGIVVFAGAAVWVFGWHIHEPTSKASRDYAPGIFIGGTVALCSGMWCCAALIGQTTDELNYRRTSDNPRFGGRLYWLQPRPQVIGDQSFDPFAYSDVNDPLKNWTSSTKNFKSNFQVHAFMAVSLVLLGYIAQFIGLRGLNAWVSIAQLIITLIMSILRGALRMQRLDRRDNFLERFPDLILGHELDWLALEIARQDIQQSGTCEESHAKPQKKLLWHITGQHERANVPARNESPTSKFKECKSSNNNNITIKPAANLTTRPYDQLFLNRVRLAHLTDHSPFMTMEREDYQPWEDESVKVRANAKRLATAICQAAATLVPEHRHGEIALRVNASVRHAVSLDDIPTYSDRVVPVKMKPSTNNAQLSWSVDSASLEAILGLSLWSLLAAEYIPNEDGTTNGISLSENPRVGTMRMIYAGNDEYGKDWELHAGDIDLEMSLWLGSGLVSLPGHYLTMRNDYKPSLVDLWEKTGRENGVETSRIVRNGGRPCKRFCGWNLVNELPKDQRLQVRAFAIDPKECSLLDVCTQDLFIALILSLVSLESPNMKEMSVVEADGDIRLESAVVAALTKAFVDSGLGTRSHAIACIVPALRTRLPNPLDEKNLMNMLKKNKEAQPAMGLRTRERAIDALLIWASRNGHEGLVHRLLESGAAIRATDRDGGTALTRAAEYGHLAVVQLLFENNAAISEMPLIWAAGRGFEAIVQQLLEQGADTEAKDLTWGQTPLIWAAESGYEAVVRLLLENGADIEATDRHGKTPLWFALRRGHDAVAKLLRERGAKECIVE